jgi:hypothetical protein
LSNKNNVSIDENRQVIYHWFSRWQAERRNSCLQVSIMSEQHAILSSLALKANQTVDEYLLGQLSSQSASLDALTQALDVLWVLVGLILVFIMQIGFGMLEAGKFFL